MLRNLVILLTVCAASLCVKAQKNMAGTILSQETNEPISFAHIIIPSEKRGTTADQFGNFEFTVQEEWLGKKLRISCVGFEDAFLTVQRTKGMTIYMKPSAEYLSAVHLSKKNKPKEVRVNSFRGKQSIGLGNFSGGAYPSMLARYYPFEESLGDENYLKEITILFHQENRYNAKFRLRLLAASDEQLPENDLMEPMIVEVTHKQGKKKIKMPANGVEVPKQGFFVVVEHLFIDENAFEETIHLKVSDTLQVYDIKQKRYAPIFKGIIEDQEVANSYYHSVDGWKKVNQLKMPKTDFKKHQVVAPAFKLTLTN